MEGLKLKIVDGPYFEMTNLVTDELLGKIFDVANEWMQQAILDLNEQGPEKVVGVHLSFKKIGDRCCASCDDVVHLKIAIATSSERRPGQDPLRAIYESEIRRQLESHAKP
jgi:hypothetical protein